MRQSAFTIYTEIAQDEPGHVEALEALLNEIGDDIAGNPHVSFADLPELHYACFAVIARPEDEVPHLLFEGNVDGRPEALLRRLLAEAGETVDRIYSHCVGYPEQGAEDPAAALAYLLAHDIGADTFYVAYPGLSVAEVRHGQHLRERIEELLDELDPRWVAAQAPEALHRWIGEQLRRDPDGAWTQPAPRRPFLVRHGGKVAALLLTPLLLGVLRVVKAAVGPAAVRRGPARALLAALVGLALEAARRLRAAEHADEQRDAGRDPDWQTAYARWSSELTGIRVREDVQVQNHMISVARVKEGAFRLAVLRIVLRVIDLVARLTANRGELGGIASIHFARWVLTPDRKHLIFLSNFDGSWESYLSDFIDRAARGLTAVWTNSDNQVGFPRTRWLVGEGARDEVRFKAYARSSMVPTNTWYSAYPDITVTNMANNLALHTDLHNDLDGAAARAWLRRL